jgi:hypothetical protein
MPSEFLRDMPYADADFGMQYANSIYAKKLKIAFKQAWY